MKNSLAVLLVVIAVLISSSAAYFGKNSQNVATTTTVTFTTTTSFGALFSQPTTFTTVTRTTLSFGGSTYATTTGEYSGCIPPVQCYPTTVTTVTFGDVPQSLSTLTELVVINPVVHFTAYVCGTNTFVAGTVHVENTTTTEYVLPSTASTSSEGFLNLTVTRVTSLAGMTSSITATTVTFTSTSRDTTICPIIA
ncbi:MAG: hypothetical protein ACHQ1H_06690 [Nitrososphaerales archaeon]